MPSINCCPYIFCFKVQKNWFLYKDWEIIQSQKCGLLLTLISKRTLSELPFSTLFCHIVKALKNTQMGKVFYLLMCGKNKDCIELHFSSLLHSCSSWVHMSCAQFLFQMRSNINNKSWEWHTYSHCSKCVGRSHKMYQAQIWHDRFIGLQFQYSLINKIKLLFSNSKSFFYVLAPLLHGTFFLVCSSFLYGTKKANHLPCIYYKKGRKSATEFELLSLSSLLKKCKTLKRPWFHKWISTHIELTCSILEPARRKMHSRILKLFIFEKFSL